MHIHNRVRSLRDRLTGEVLPFWRLHGVDAATGRFEERLDLQGRAVEGIDLRAMVQARQIYVYAHAARLGWYPEGLGVAVRAAERLFADWPPPDARDGSAGLVFSIRRDGAVANATRDAYAHAFVLFALAHLAQATGEAGYLDRADNILGFMDRTLADTVAGGLHDRVPEPPGFKRQNPHMHLFEALLALHAADPARGYIARAKVIASLFSTRFFDASKGMLLEYFEPDWSRRESQDGRYFEPGHHFEWVWLLAEYQRAAGERLAAADVLWEVAHKFGVAESGHVVEEVADDGRVRLASHRIWPFTEALKAAAARHEAGDAAAADFADRLLGLFEAGMIGRPFAAGWYDRFETDGRPLVDYVPASTLYHVFLAATEADRVFGH